MTCSRCGCAAHETESLQVGERRLCLACAQNELNPKKPCDSNAHTREAFVATRGAPGERAAVCRPAAADG